TIWYSVDRDGIVTVNITRAEMGQHIATAVARILADELEVDWSNVRILMVDTDPKWGVMSTGGSKSVWLDFPIYSRAGAAGRIVLIEAGAKLLGVSPSQCLALGHARSGSWQHRPLFAGAARRCRRSPLPAGGERWSRRQSERVNSLKRA